MNIHKSCFKTGLILFNAYSSVKKLFTEVVQEKRKLLFDEELHFELQQNKDETFDDIFTAHYFSNVTKSIKF